MNNIENTAPQHLTIQKSEKDTRNIINISGGKDSTALWLLANELEERKTIFPIFCDTGHEHPMTYKYLEYLQKTLGQNIKVLKADFTDDFQRKREYIITKWPEDHIPKEHIETAIKCLQPTGSPFLDLCLLKGRFPSAKARFCTEELKVNPANEHMLGMVAKNRNILSWQGVRRDESPARANLSHIEYLTDNTLSYSISIYRPILNWTAQNVFNYINHHGLYPNPLYKMGMKRVGCMPCIMVSKEELAEIARRFPDQIERVRLWEKLVSKTAKRGASTLLHRHGKPEELNIKKIWQYFNIDSTVEYAKTGHGGKQYDILKTAPAEPCSSAYGLCE